MLITVPSANSATLLSLLPEATSTYINESANGSKVLIQNKGATSIYAEYEGTATTTGGVEIATGASLSWSGVGDLHLISATSPNTNVRVLIKSL